MKRILIVDDDEFFLQGLKKALQTGISEQIAEVVTTGTVEAALAEIAAAPFQICFLDLFLPDVHGTEALRTFNALSPAMKVIVMSAGILNEEMKDSIERNAFLFLPKPFDLLQIRMLVRRIVENQDN